MNRRHQFLLAAGLGLLAGCAAYNAPLGDDSPSDGYSFEAVAEGDGDHPGDTLVVLTFSGGGTRAAAFAFGALEALEDVELTDGRTLLDEVDIVSSVSGGSFTAAYLGLFGKQRLFEEFPERVLYRSLERDLILRLLAPWNWPRLLSHRFSRSDLAAGYYGSELFENQTYADMPRRAPFVVLNATDISRGAQFSFIQDHFDRLCSDLDSVPVGVAVTASSAFPIAFPPITLKNYSKRTCHYRTPEWVELALEDRDLAPQRYALAKTWLSYEDYGARPYIHLSDGGIADNIGYRAFESAIERHDGWGLARRINDGSFKRFVLIVVNAKSESEPKLDRCPRAPGIIPVLHASATNPIENYSSDTTERARLFINQWNDAVAQFDAVAAGCEQLAARLCEHKGSTCRRDTAEACRGEFGVTNDFRPPAPDLYTIHVRFDSIPDPVERERLQAVGTRLQLPGDEVDLAIKWGRELLLRSEQLESLRDSLRD